MAHASLFPEPLDDYSLQLASKMSLSHFQNVSGRARIKLKFPRAQALIYKVPRGEQELPTNQPVLHQICYHLFTQCSLPTANRSLSHDPPVLTPSSDYCFKQIYQQAMGKSVTSSADYRYHRSETVGETSTRPEIRSDSLLNSQVDLPTCF